MWHFRGGHEGPKPQMRLESNRDLEWPHLDFLVLAQMVIVHYIICNLTRFLGPVGFVVEYFVVVLCYDLDGWPWLRIGGLG